MTTQKGMELLKIVSQYISKSKGHDRILNKVSLVSGGNGMCTAEFKVEAEHLNGGGGLHGGYIATLVDSISTYALMTSEKSDGMTAGVSVDIHVNYIKGAREGDEIVVDAKTVKCGRTLAFLEIELKKKGTNDIIAKGTHTKFIGNM